MTNEEVERATIVRAEFGSKSMGLNLDEAGDRDEMGVYIEPMAGVVGFHDASYEQHIHRTAAVREGRHDAKSQPGDVDSVIYGLRKFLRLALKGNPQLVSLLFVKPEDCYFISDLGRQMQALAPAIVSRQAGKAFLGYLQAQKQRLMGERGQKAVNRPELVANHGYDTKYAYHILRLGEQGVELMSTGRLTLPLPEEQRAYIMDVRLGKVPLNDMLSLAGALERQLKDLIKDSPLPDHPDELRVEQWMLDTYRECWKQDANFWPEDSGWPSEI